MSMPVGIAGRLVSPFVGVVNRARLGFPSRFFQGAGRIGDDLICTTVFRELRKPGKRGDAIATRHPGVTGPVELRPYIFLTKTELAAGRLAENQVALQSTGLASPLALLNREW